MDFSVVTRITDLPYFQQKHFPKDDMLATKENGSWVKVSTADFIARSEKLARALIHAGVNPGDKIGTITHVNQAHWNICDMAIALTGAIHVPVYPTISSADYQYIFTEAEIKFCIVSNNELAEKVKAVKSQIPTLKEIFSYYPIPGLRLYTDLVNDGLAPETELQKRKNDIKPENLVTIIYTSGTTGVPKGVMLSHKNIISNAVSCTNRIPYHPTYVALSFLPVNHVYERMLHYLYMLTGISIYFAESMDTIGDNLREVRPQIFTAVPRLLEKVYDKIMVKGNELTGFKKKLFFWSLHLAEKYEIHGKSIGYKINLWIARKLVFKKWKAALGGRSKAIASGSAPLQPRLARVFLGAGIPVWEGYGLTETSPVISVNCSKHDGIRIGTVGRIISGVEVRLANDGEILVKGPNIMMGYYKKPNETAEVITPDGWLHTGDIGTWVDKDFLKITDRKKEIFKTSGGKYIAPQPMENAFKESAFVEQILVTGDGRHFPSALVVPAVKNLETWCKQNNIAYTTPEEACTNPLVNEMMMNEINRINQRFGHWEQVKKIHLLAKEWTIDAGELTPNLKLKRKFIQEKFKNEIAAMYQ
jgi:long-chain acyl-CoA synthetase